MKQLGDHDYVIIVGASDLVMPAYHLARNNLGLKIIAFDYNPKAPGMEYSDIAIPVSTKDVTAAVSAAQNLAKRHRIRGVFTCGADVEITVAAIAEALALPGIKLDVAMRCNDKLLMHRYLDTLDFKDKARYCIVHTQEEALQSTPAIGFPCIIKPLDNCASRGVQRVDAPDVLPDAYDLAASFNTSKDGRVLIEEYLQGTKHTIEMIAWHGQWHLLSIIDTHYISPRWPCETGLNTTQQPPAMQERMFTFASNVARLIGIDFNAHKVDVNIAPDGSIKLIELTARLSGGFHCQYASPLAFGSNDILAALKLAVGMRFDMEDIRHKYEKGSAVRAVFPKPGRVMAINGVDEAKVSPGVAEVFVWCKIGDQVGPYLNSADRPAFVIAAGETTDEAIINAERGASLVDIRTI